MSHFGTVLALLVAFVFGPALPVKEAKANPQMCSSMMQMMMMLQQVKAQATEQKKAETRAYMTSKMDSDISNLFSSKISRSDKKKIRDRLIARTPLTMGKLKELKGLSPSNRLKKLQSLGSDLKTEMSSGLESSTNNAMVMAIMGMLLCQMMSSGIQA